MRNPLNILAVLILGVFLVAGSAMALPVYDDVSVSMYLKQNTFPADLSEQKVFLDMATAGSITGHVGSQADPRLVTFSSTTDTLDAANGYSTIKAVDGYLNNITITAPGYYFEDLIFSVNLTPDNPIPQTDLSVLFVSLAGSGSYSGWSSQPNWVSGDNRILLLADPGNLIRSVTINSVAGLGSIGGIDQIKQTEISGLTPVPEPSTMLLFGTSLVGLAAFGRKKLLQK